VLDSGLPEQVADAEPLTRFLTSDSQYNRESVRPSGFMPGPRDGNTSVLRMDADSPDALWATADQWLGADRRAKAAAVLSALAVRRATLEVLASEPPPRHADITGWPEVANDPDATRARRKELALLLTQAASLHRR